MNFNTIEDFIKNSPVPFAGTQEWEDWKRLCHTYSGEQSCNRLIELLKFGNEIYHYRCMMALRQFGYETGQIGEGEETIYSVQNKGQDYYIEFTPLHCPQAPGSIDDLNSGKIKRPGWKQYDKLE